MGRLLKPMSDKISLIRSHELCRVPDDGEPERDPNKTYLFYTCGQGWRVVRWKEYQEGGRWELKDSGDRFMLSVHNWCELA